MEQKQMSERVVVEQELRELIEFTIRLEYELEAVVNNKK